MYYILIPLFFSVSILKAQQTLYPAGGIDIFVNNEKLLNPWAGGLDLPQISPVDINQDGIDDIVIFDKRGNKFLTFLGTENKEYIYAPQYENIYPSDIRTFALLRDFNCDGLVDIFTNAQGTSGFRVYKQILTPEGKPTFELEKPLLEFPVGEFMVNIAKLNMDIPIIADIDGDGDLDIIVMSFSLGTTPYYYKNTSIENGYGCDSLMFVEETFCWGNFREGFSSSVIELDYCCMGDCSTPPAPLVPKNDRHAGTTFTAIDPDEDGVYDLLVGDVDQPTLAFLKNGGTSEYANMIEKDMTFPYYDIPVNLYKFPAAYELDANFDGKKDIIVAPNADDGLFKNTNNIHYYKNTGNANEPYEFVQNDFLINTMLDYGSFSHVNFEDFTGNGLKDMLISNGYIFNGVGDTEGSLFLFENTGTAENPEFNFITDNFAGVKNLGLEFVRPTFGDIDGDGDLDMIIGDINGFIHLFINDAGVGNAPNFVLSQLQYKGIDVGSFCHPFLVDLNNDGLLDLVIGRAESRGELLYFENIGIASEPDFSSTPTNSKLGEIQTNEPQWLLGFSSPFITEPDINNQRFLYSGSDIGFIKKYLINQDSIYEGSFELIEEAVLPAKAGIRTTVAVLDLNNDGFLDYFVGNSRGGLHYYSEAITDSSIVDVDSINSIAHLEILDFNLYPNPANNYFIIETEKTLNAQIYIYNTIGQIVHQEAFSGEQHTVYTNNWNRGVYFVKIEENGIIGTRKIVVQ